LFSVQKSRTMFEEVTTMNEDQTYSTIGTKDTAGEVTELGAETTAGANEQVHEAADKAKSATDAPADDFRDALSNFSAALDRLGSAAEHKARAEWAEGKPEVDRAVNEVKKGLDGLIRKSAGLIDSFSGKLTKGANTAGETVVDAAESTEAAEASPESRPEQASN
jgi:hypothetical protein